jgi:hypothetical protein
MEINGLKTGEWITGKVIGLYPDMVRVRIPGYPEPISILTSSFEGDQANFQKIGGVVKFKLALCVNHATFAGEDGGSRMFPLVKFDGTVKSIHRLWVVIEVSDDFVEYLELPKKTILAHRSNLGAGMRMLLKMRYVRPGTNVTFDVTQYQEKKVAIYLECLNDPSYEELKTWETVKRLIHLGRRHQFQVIPGEYQEKNETWNVTIKKGSFNLWLYIHRNDDIRIYLAEALEATEK